MSLNLVFMGTPDFAVPCLKALVQEGYQVSGVFSQPDRPRGRGNKVSYSPVKELAVAHQIPVFQPTNFSDGEAVGVLEQLKPDLIVVVAYGRILPPAVLGIPRLGCINVHGSLLPKLRGAAPIQWSILKGDKVTGITTMYLAEGMDTGDMLLQRETPIAPTETAGELFERLAPLGAQLLLETLVQIEEGTAPRIPQEEAEATYAPRITKGMGLLDFAKSAEELVNQVRGLNPWPSAYSFLGEERVIIHRAIVANGQGTTGEIIDPKKLVVACGKGAIQLLEVQPQGKKVVDGLAFANGRRLVGGEKFKSLTYSV